MQNGDTIECAWINDRLNGLAIVTKQNEAAPNTVIFKDDMKIMANDSGVTCCDYFYICVSITLFIVFYGAIPLAVLSENSSLFGAMGVYLIYQIWSCAHHATRYLSNLIGLDKIFGKIEAAIASKPEVDFHI